MITSHRSDEYKNVAFIEVADSSGIADVQELEEILSGYFDDECPFIIIDLAKATEVSGVIIGDLLEWKSKFHATLNGDLVVTSASSAVENHLMELEADKVFRLFEDNDAALNYLNWEYQGLSENLLFSIPNQLNVVPALRNLVKKCVLAKGYSNREAFQIETIIDELCNNAIEHGNHGVEGVVEIALAIGKNKIEINIANGIEFINGEQSSPEAITRVMETFRDKPSSSIDNPRGRGLALVQMLANEFDIDSSDDGTCVHVTKYREV